MGYTSLESSRKLVQRLERGGRIDTKTSQFQEIFNNRYSLSYIAIDICTVYVRLNAESVGKTNAALAMSASNEGHLVALETRFVDNLVEAEFVWVIRTAIHSAGSPKSARDLLEQKL